jgi:hypothetical protein
MVVPVVVVVVANTTANLSSIRNSLTNNRRDLPVVVVFDVMVFFVASHIL